VSTRLPLPDSTAPAVPPSASLPVCAHRPGSSNDAYEAVCGARSCASISRASRMCPQVETARTAATIANSGRSDAAR
jgi:hypothetical protein